MPFNASDGIYDFKGAFEEKAGVYGLMNVVKHIIFVGQTKNLKDQIAETRANLYDWVHRDGPRFVCFEEIGDESTRAKRAHSLIQEYSAYTDAGNRL